MAADLDFFFDPVCPFCWVTSRWVRRVQQLRGIDVDWRLLSLKLVNEPLGYEDKPDEYPAVHQRGLELLRVAAAVGDELGNAAVGRFYETAGATIWETDPQGAASIEQILARTATPVDLDAVLTAAGLPPELADAADEDRWDKLVQQDTDEAIERVGGDVGTPILSFSPPDGPAFFGPVISQEPEADEDVLRTWDAVVTLARWPGFAELKRSLRQFPVTRLTAELGGQDTRVS